jgi:Family of unknown function (DUF6518)
MSNRWWLAFAVALGVALGLFSLLGDGLSADTPMIVLIALANAAGPWLVTSFAAGALAPDRSRGAISGALALSIAVVTYYLGLAIRDLAPADLAVVSIAWIGVAVVVGPVFGAAGGTWRSRRSPVAVAILTGALLAEAAYRFIELEAWDGIDVTRTSMQVTIVNLVAAIAAPVLLLPRDRWPVAYGLTVAFAPIGLALVALVTWAVQAVRF